MRKLKNDEAPMAATIEASNLPVNYETTDMKSLAKSTAKCTNSIAISGIKIHMEAEGRYSLNDLHKASGDEQRHRPKYWLELNQTTELIDEILKGGITPFKNDSVSNAGIPVFKPVVSKKGRYGGTYVCKELVYSYAMWISAAFALKVIRAYDVVVTGNTNEAVRIAKTTVSDRTPLRDAVNMLVGKKGLRYDDAYNMVHQRFAIDSIDELELSQIPQAVEYIHRVILDGEFIGKQESLPKPELNLNYGMDFFDKYRWIVGDKALSAPWFYSPEMLTTNGDYPNPCGRLLADMKDAGYSVEAAIFQLQALQHHLCLCLRKIDRVQQAVTH